MAWFKLFDRDQGDKGRLVAELGALNNRLSEAQENCNAERSINGHLAAELEATHEKNQALSQKLERLNQEAADCMRARDLLIAGVRERTVDQNVTLGERERLLHKNFAELQRREGQLEQLIASRAELQFHGQRQALLKEVHDKSIEIVAAQVRIDGLEAETMRSLEQATELQRKLDISEIEVKRLQQQGGTSSVVWDLKRQIDALTKDNAWTAMRTTSLETEVAEAKPNLQRSAQMLQSSQQDLSKWKRISADKDQKLAILTEQVQQELHRATDLQNQVAKLPRPDFTPFASEAVLAWLCMATGPKQLDIELGHLHLMGDGPWDVDVLGRQVENQGFKLRALPDDEVAHVVVGRNGWSSGDLTQHIDARQGLGLRIYSQEMWVAAMATGRDPFDTDDIELLDGFAMGHDALEYLRGPGFDWPELAPEASSKVTLVSPGEVLGVLESPMHLMDYRVGITSPHNPETRHEILDKIFRTKTLPFHPDCSLSYRERWGGPRSPQRLYRMATHIRHVLDGPNGIPLGRFQAKEDWTSDLSWLKSTYFIGKTLGFKWPHTGAR
jgi:hypothetical protein